MNKTTTTNKKISYKNRIDKYDKVMFIIIIIIILLIVCIATKTNTNYQTRFLFKRSGKKWKGKRSHVITRY